MAAEGLGEKEIFTKEAINIQTPNDNSDSKSDMASRINNRELITFNCPNQMPTMSHKSSPSSLKKSNSVIETLIGW